MPGRHLLVIDVYDLKSSATVPHLLKLPDTITVDTDQGESIQRTGHT